MTNTLPELVTAHSVAKRLGIPLAMALEIPTDALMAMSRYIEGTSGNFDREKVARLLRVRYNLRQSVPELMVGLDVAMASSAAPPSKKVAP